MPTLRIAESDTVAAFPKLPCPSVRAPPPMGARPRCAARRTAGRRLDVVRAGLGIGFVLGLVVAAAPAWADEPAAAPNVVGEVPTRDDAPAMATGENKQPIEEIDLERLLNSPLSSGLGAGVLVPEFHGFLNFEAYSFGKDNEHPIPSFDLHQLYMASKIRVGDTTTLFAEVEYEHGGTVRIDRAFVDWRPATWLTLRAGRFYVPFSYERTHYWAPVRMLTSRPLSVDVPFHEWADTGVHAQGRVKWLGFDLAIVNGPFALTENGLPITDVRDHNSNKTVIGRLNFYPVEQLEGGVAYAAGAYDKDSKLKYRMVELDARLRLAHFEVWTEVDRRFADDEPCSAATSVECDPLFTSEPGNRLGYYVLLAYTFEPKVTGMYYLRPVFRYDTLESNPGTARVSGTRRFTAGLNWSPRPNLIVRAEYQKSIEFGRPELDNDGATAALVTDF